MKLPTALSAAVSRAPSTRYFLPAPGLRWCFLLSALLLAGFQWEAGAQEASAEGKVVLDWSAEGAGAPPQRWVGDVAVGSWGQGHVEMMVVNKDTEPPSPFPEAKPALRVERTEGRADGVLWIKPFITPPLKGWMKMEFILKAESIGVMVANGSPTPGPRFDQKSLGTQLFMATMRPDDKIALRIEPATVGQTEEAVYTGLERRTETERPCTFVIRWDFTANPPTIQFDLDDEPILTNSGEAFTIEVDPEAAKTGPDTFTIGGVGFIGNVTVSPE